MGFSTFYVHVSVSQGDKTIRRAIQAALRDVSAFWQQQHTCKAQHLPTRYIGSTDTCTCVCRRNFRLGVATCAYCGRNNAGRNVAALCKFFMQEYFRPLAAVASKLVMIH